MPKNYGGQEINYHVHEVPVEEYTTARSGMDLINTHENETVEVSGKKTWTDNEDNDGLRPESIVIKLMQDGKEYARKTVTERDDWAWSFTDLPKYTDRKEHVYTIEEEAVAGYTAAVTGYDVTNTHEDETIDVLGHKTWNDNNNNDGVRPARLTVYLVADGVRTEKYHTTTADRNWYWIFEDLPKYDEGREIVYTFEEETVTGYTGPVITKMTTLPQGYGDIGYELVNTHEDKTVEIAGTKTWSDNDDQDGKRPDAITIRLWKITSKGQTEVASKTVTEKENWAWDFGKLPEYEGGEKIVYTITEDIVPGYSTTITGYDVENSYTPGKISISGMKYWNDGNDQDGLRPDEIVVHLWKTVAGQTTKINTKTVTAADNWQGQFNDLPEYEDGEVIVYSITEDAVPGYTTEINQYDIINTHIPEKVDVAGQKTWNDNDDQDGMRPQRITIRLHKTVDGVTSEIKNAAVTEANSWKWHFVDLPKYENGKEITYTVTEDAVEGYTSQQDGYSFTNTHSTEENSVSGAKTWNDNNDQDGKRPASITINLLANGKKVASKTVTASNGWMWAFTELPKYEGGKLITYTITEEPVANYTSVVDGYNVTNSYTTETTSVSGAKTWNDNNDQDGKRPASITINLLANGEKVASKTVTEKDGWKWTFDKLPKYEGGKLIAYTITENAVSGYTTMVAGYDVVNSRGVDTTSICGKKTWVGDEDAVARRPESITIYLLADGVRTASKTVTAKDGWAWTFDNLPVNKNGQPIVYTIEEEPVARYASQVNGYDVTNVYGCTNFAFTKRWRGVTGGTLTMVLYANGEKVEPQPKLTRYGDVYVWEDLPQYDAKGNELVYYAVEASMEGYLPEYENPAPFEAEKRAVYPGGAITNVEVTSVSVRKVWADVEEGEELPQIQLVLYRNGVATDVPMPAATVGGWYIYENLPAEVNGVRAHYTVKENPVDGFMTIYTTADGEEALAAADGDTITNKKIPVTGDNTPLTMWIALMSASAAMLLVIFRRRKA